MALVTLLSNVDAPSTSAVNTGTTAERMLIVTQTTPVSNASFGLGFVDIQCCAASSASFAATSNASWVPYRSVSGRGAVKLPATGANVFWRAKAVGGKGITVQIGA